MTELMPQGDRIDYVEGQKTIRKNLLKEGNKFAKDIQKEEKKLLDELKMLEKPGVYSEFTVSWKQEGKLVTLGPTGDMTPRDFSEVIKNVNRAIMKKLDDGRGRKIKVIKGRLQEMPGIYRRKKEALETKIFHCDERIARYS